MRTRVVIGAVLFLAVLAVSALGAVGRPATVVRFTRPIIVAGISLLGPVVFEHDDARMARGEPCTTVYHYDAKRNARGDVLVQFMCVPKARPVATKFEAVIQFSSPTGPDRLLEYQMEGEAEGHGVPYSY